MLIALLPPAAKVTSIFDLWALERFTDIKIHTSDSESMIKDKKLENEFNCFVPMYFGCINPVYIFTGIPVEKAFKMNNSLYPLIEFYFQILLHHRKNYTRVNFVEQRQLRSKILQPQPV